MAEPTGALGKSELAVTMEEMASNQRRAVSGGGEGRGGEGRGGEGKWPFGITDQNLDEIIQKSSNLYILSKP